MSISGACFAPRLQRNCAWHLRPFYSRREHSGRSTVTRKICGRFWIKSSDPFRISWWGLGLACSAWARSAWCGKHRRKAPPDMLTGRPVQACLCRDVCRESSSADLYSTQESRWLSFGGRSATGRSRTREAHSYPRSGPQPERT